MPCHFPFASANWAFRAELSRCKQLLGLESCGRFKVLPAGLVKDHVEFLAAIQLASKQQHGQPRPMF